MMFSNPCSRCLSFGHTVLGCPQFTHAQRAAMNREANRKAQADYQASLAYQAPTADRESE